MNTTIKKPVVVHVERPRYSKNQRENFEKAADAVLKRMTSIYKNYN